MKLALYSGAGNTFLLADHREGLFPIARIPELCALHHTDGVVLVESHSVADAAMRIFNRDGSEAEMCGNGLRCFIKFLKELGIQRPIYKISTLAGMHTAWCVGEEVSIGLPMPCNLKLSIRDNLHYVNTGVPHAVVCVEAVERVDVAALGKKIRHDPYFAPEGTNVNFMEIRGTNALAIRTFERGVEAETSACGTGAVAAAFIAKELYNLISPITICVASGDLLKVDLSDKGGVSLQGPATRMSIHTT